MKKYERTRERDSLRDHVLNYEAKNKDGDVTGTSQTILSDLLGVSEEMHDVVVPQYDRLSQEGQVIINPMWKVTNSRELSASTLVLKNAVTGGYNTYTYQGGHYLIAVTNGVGHSRVSHLSTEDVDKHQLAVLAGTSAQSNIVEPTFEGLVFVGELRETLRFLRNPLGSVAKLLQSYKRTMKARRRRCKRNPKARECRMDYTLADFVADNWLSYRYAITPLVLDAQNAVEAIQNRSKTAPKRQTARGYSSDSKSAIQTFTDTSAFVSTSKNVQTVLDGKARAGILYQADYSDSFGIKAHNIPAAVWELIPFSFVSDWFVNLGDWVRAITPKAGVNVLGSWTVLETTTTTTAQGSTSSGTNSSWSVSTASSSSETLIDRSVSREPSHAVGIASKPLPFSGDLGKKRIIDSLALIHNLLNSR